MIEIPPDWQLTPLGEEFEIQQGKSLSPISRRGENPRPFLRTSNVLWGRIDLSTVDQMDFTDEEFSRLSLVDGDLLVCEGGDIGRAAVYRGPSGQYAYQNHLHRLRAKTDEIIPDFVVHWLRAAFTQLGLYEGIGNKTTIPNLSRARLSQLQIPKPDPEEQKQVAGILGHLQRAIEVETAICEKLAVLKSATMAKLFREGLRGEPLKQTEIGEIPESWEVVRIGDHCTRMNYGTSQRCTTQLASYPVLRIPNIIHGTIETTDLKYAQPGDLTEKEIEKLRLEPGDLLFVRTNGNREYTGRCAVYEGCPEGALFASYLIRVRLSGDVLVPHFVQQFLSEVGREQIAGRANPAADGKFNIDTSILRSLAIPRPPKSEQQEIISILAALDERRRLAQEKSAALQRLFSSLLHALMTGAIRVKDLDLAEVSRA
jgi:type I restriction enzyme S subunit